jgi:hypothetical protein
VNLEPVSKEKRQQGGEDHASQDLTKAMKPRCERPPTRKMITAVMIVIMTTEAKMESQPRSMAGKRIWIRVAAVNTKVIIIQ